MIEYTQETTADTAAARQQLITAFDDPRLDSLCMDHFPQVYDRFSRGMRKDEKINALLDHCRRNPREWERLNDLVVQAESAEDARLQQTGVKSDTLMGNLVRLRGTVLTHYETEEQEIVARYAKRLDRTQLTTLQIILRALKANRIPGTVMEQALDVVKRTLQTLPQHVADSIDRQTVEGAVEGAPDVKHKLKLSLPIIPVLLSYGGGLMSSSEMNLRAVWKRLKETALAYKRLLLCSAIIAGILGVASVLVSHVWQLDVPQRSIVAGLFCLAIAMVLWVGSCWARIPITRMSLALKMAIATMGALLLIGGLTVEAVWTIKTIYCRNAQVSPCLKLDLASGTREVCPDKDGVIVLPPNSLARQSCLSGQATVTPSNGCPCTWIGRADSGIEMEALHENPTQSCSFAFSISNLKATTYYLTLVVHEQHQPMLFSIRGQNP